jgi:hypothetical protein
LTESITRGKEETKTYSIEMWYSVDKYSSPITNENAVGMMLKGETSTLTGISGFALSKKRVGDE